jgi:hypothetical protein
MYRTELYRIAEYRIWQLGMQDETSGPQKIHTSCQTADSATALDDSPPRSDSRRGRHPSLEGGITVMTTFPRRLRHLPQLAGMLLALLVDALRYLGLCLRPSAALAAENLFLRKQLALYQERHIKPKRATRAAPIALLWLARWFDWWQSSAVV